MTLRFRTVSEDACKVWMVRTGLRARLARCTKKIKILVDVAAIFIPELLVYSFGINSFPIADRELSLDFEIIFT